MVGRDLISVGPLVSEGEQTAGVQFRILADGKRLLLLLRSSHLRQRQNHQSNDAIRDFHGSVTLPARGSKPKVNLSS
jgi:hypothetical protein